MKVWIPLRLTGSLNAREHWGARQRRVKKERNAVALLLPPRPKGPCPELTVTLTRVAPHELDDDNLQGRLKAVRDQVAAWLGLDDRDKRVSWRYAQAKPGKPREHWVTVELEARQ